MSRDMVGWNPGRGSSSRNEMLDLLAQKISLISSIREMWFYSDHFGCCKTTSLLGRYLRYQGDFLAKQIWEHIISTIIEQGYGGMEPR